MDVSADKREIIDDKVILSKFGGKVQVVAVGIYKGVARTKAAWLSE